MRETFPFAHGRRAGRSWLKLQVSVLLKSNPGCKQATLLALDLAHRRFESAPPAEKLFRVILLCHFRIFPDPAIPFAPSRGRQARHSHSDQEQEHDQEQEPTTRAVRRKLRPWN